MKNKLMRSAGAAVLLGGGFVVALSGPAAADDDERVCFFFHDAPHKNICFTSDDQPEGLLETLVDLL